LYSAKTNQKNSYEEIAVSLLFVSDNPGEVFELEFTYRKQTVLSEPVNFARNLQILPPNLANSEYLAKKIENKLNEYANHEVKVLDKEQIKDLNMGLLL
ncbi:leucyl aminopeptidase family protein, partial [Mycoplasmopsis synoviae]